MLDKIKKLEELGNINFHKDINLAVEWIDTIPLDKEKINRWHVDVIKNLKAINIKYAKMFNNIQENVSKEYHLDDIRIEQNLENSRNCLLKIIAMIKNQYKEF